MISVTCYEKGDGNSELERFHQTSLSSEEMNSVVDALLPSYIKGREEELIGLSQPAFHYHYEYDRRNKWQDRIAFSLIVLRTKICEWHENHFSSITDTCLEHLESLFRNDISFLPKGFIFQWSELRFRSKHSPFFHGHIHGVLPINEEIEETFYLDSIENRAIYHATAYSGSDVVVIDNREVNDKKSVFEIRLKSVKTNDTSQIREVQIYREIDSYVFDFGDLTKHPDRPLFWWWNHGDACQRFRLIKDSSNEEFDSFYLQPVTNSGFIKLQPVDAGKCFLKQHSFYHLIISFILGYKLCWTDDQSEATSFIVDANILSSLDPFVTPLVALLAGQKIPLSSIFVPYVISEKKESYQKSDSQRFKPRNDLIIRRRIGSLTPSGVYLCPHKSFSLQFLAFSCEEFFSVKIGESSLLSRILHATRFICRQLNELFTNHRYCGYNVYLRIWKLINANDLFQQGEGKGERLDEEEFFHYMSNWDEERNIINFHNIDVLNDIIYPNENSQRLIIFGYLELDPQSQYMILSHSCGEYTKNWIQEYKKCEKLFYSV